MAEQIAEREEKLKELNRLKSEFVSNISQELQTSLTTIKTLVRILQRNYVSDCENEEYLQTIAVECDRLIEFLQNLLDLSRIESGAYRVSIAIVDAVKIVGDAIETHRTTALSYDLSLDLKKPENEKIFVLTDADVLRRVISSLIENAVKYTPKGGIITVYVNRRGEWAEIIVEDNGCGIAAEDLPHIFDRFYRGQPLETNNGDEQCIFSNEVPGIGLGLYLVKGLVKQIEAEIYAESLSPASGNGTRLTLLVPISSFSI